MALLAQPSKDDIPLGCPERTALRKEQCGVAPKSRITERPLLDNGSVATNPAPFSGQQINTFNQQRIYNRPLHGNATIVSKKRNP
jgi:hypothetical protein